MIPAVLGKNLRVVEDVGRGSAQGDGIDALADGAEIPDGAEEVGLVEIGIGVDIIGQFHDRAVLSQRRSILPVHLEDVGRLAGGNRGDDVVIGLCVGKLDLNVGMRSVEVINQLLIAVRGEGRLVGLSIHGPDSDHNRLAGHVLRGARGFRTGIGVVSVVRGFFCAAGSKQTNDHHNSQQQRKNLFHYGSS